MFIPIKTENNRRLGLKYHQCNAGGIFLAKPFFIFYTFYGIVNIVILKNTDFI
jgi:hypothetical protein